MTISELKKEVYRLAEENIEFYDSIGQTLYEHPELGNREFWSSKFLVEEISKRGFRVEYPYGGLATAFRAEIGEGHPKVAFLAEYDALPGYGPNGDQNGHACGHNWIAAASFGAADVLAKLSENFKGTIVYMGTPAEETVGGKIDLVNAGCFEDIDAVFQMHLSSNESSKLNGTSLAMDSIEFSFEGKAAHASGRPWEGINALDAAQLTFAGINALRQHVLPSSRIHGIISEGGLAPNIVPAHAAAKFYIRAEKRDYLNTLTEKVINCAKGAALMTGATMTYRYFENPFDDLQCNQVLVKRLAGTLDEIGYTNYDASPQGPSGSTDIGNVSRVVPTCYMDIDVENTDGSACHEELFLQHVVGPLAHKACLTAVKAMAATAAEVFMDEELRKQIAK